MIEENNKFLSFNGVIGRRGFIINWLYILIIKSLVLTTPAVYLMFAKPQGFIDFLRYTVVNNVQPQWWLLWEIAVSTILMFLILPSVIRRIRDIAGKDIKGLLPVCTLVLFVLFSMGSFTAGIAMIILMCIETSDAVKRPHNDVLKFNWAAFLGTWIWGLFNKSYKTLWMIPLIFTAGWLPFAVICGMKGNKWAYKAAGGENYEEFKTRQENQAVAWVFIAPVIFLLTCISAVIISGTILNNYSKNHPDFAGKVGNYYSQVQEISINQKFDKIELREDYKFYIDPEIWVKMSAASKEEMLNSAGLYSAIKKDANFDVVTNNMTAPPEIIRKVKIISTFNGEILGECKYQNQTEANPTGTRSYRFNPYPSLP